MYVRGSFQLLVAAGVAAGFILMGPHANYDWTNPAIGSPAERVSIRIPTYMMLEPDTSTPPFEPRRSGVRERTAYYAFRADHHRPPYLRWLFRQDISVDSIELFINYSSNPLKPSDHPLDEKIGYLRYPSAPFFAFSGAYSADRKVRAIAHIRGTSSADTGSACKAVLQTLQIR